MLAVKGLPPQQQLLLCAAANLIGDASAQTPLKGTPSRRLSGLGCSTPMSAGNTVRPPHSHAMPLLWMVHLCNIHPWKVTNILFQA